MLHSCEMRRDPEVHQTEPVSNAASRSAALDVALLSLATVVAVLSFAKNFSNELNPGGDPYFFFTYSDGFIKRGLVGHVFNTIYPHRPKPPVRPRCGPSPLPQCSSSR